MATKKLPESSLNAPFGARCFLTREANYDGPLFGVRLNAPFGARCFLTYNRSRPMEGGYSMS